MKPYGRKPKHHNYEDNHPPKGYVNWWEFELDSLNKKTARQFLKKETEIETVRYREEIKYGRS